MLYLLLCNYILITIVKGQYDDSQNYTYSVEEHTGEEAITSQFESSTNKEIYCDNFDDYARQCLLEAASMSNITKFSPPEPKNFNSWCKSLKHMGKCMTKWNKNCFDFADLLFHDDSINGNKYVVKNLCTESYYNAYKNTSDCLDATSREWEECYENFKHNMDKLLNDTLDASHYTKHFYLCCERKRFRSCTLKSTLDKCSLNETLVMQNFSVVISEGEVFQDCNFNIVYSSCPGGDPGQSIVKLLETRNHSSLEDKARYLCVIILLIYILK